MSEVMLILRGIKGNFDGRDWPRGALYEEPALEYARRTGFVGRVLDIDGATGPGNRQVRMALANIRADPNIRGLYGFSGGGFNIPRIWHELSEEERKQIRTIVILGAPGVDPDGFDDCENVIVRLDPAGGHMHGPQALLDVTPDIG